MELNGEKCYAVATHSSPERMIPHAYSSLAFDPSDNDLQPPR
jgi:hypothetical protein